VAIKVLAPHLATSGAARKRFAREAQAAAAIVHENVIAIHGVDEALGLPYLVMPYVKGESLQRRLDNEGPLELKEILRIAQQTAAGLSAAHAQGLIHRDVKPANILLADGVERVTITDFGLARAADDASLTRTGTIAGTPQYMSPEQARGEAVDHRTDLFSLGSVIHAMCTGRAPFRADSTYGVLRRISDAHPRPVNEINSEIPAWLARLVGRLHAKSPADRYASASTVADDLQQCLAHVQQPSRESLPAWLAESGFRRFLAKPAFVVGCLLAAVVVIGVLIGGYAWMSPTDWRRSPAPNVSQSAADAPPGDSATTEGHAGDSADMAAAAKSEGAQATSTERPMLDSAGVDWVDGTELELLELDHELSLLEEELELDGELMDGAGAEDFEL
jgi:serine/threonine-protein kinase